MTAESWDVAAEAWEAFEEYGLGPADLDRIADLHGPALVVGAGQGVLVESLVRRGIDAIGADWSRRMIERAHERRPGLTMLRASADRLPFADASFATVVLATGLLDRAYPERAAAVLDEAHRIARPAAAIVIGMFGLDRDAEREASGIGIGYSTAGLRHAVELWSLERQAWSAAVAGWTGTTEATATARLAHARANVNALMGLFDRAADVFRARGHDPRSSLLECAESLADGVCDEAAIAEVESRLARVERHVRGPIVVLVAERSP